MTLALPAPRLLQKVEGASSYHPKDFKGSCWSATTSQADLDFVRDSYRVPDSIVSEAPDLDRSVGYSKDSLEEWPFS